MQAGAGLKVHHLPELRDPHLPDRIIHHLCHHGGKALSSSTHVNR
jgi:hypothetical protein